MASASSISRVVFLDVDPEDRALVQERFPQAGIFGHLEDGEVIQQCGGAEVISHFITTKFTKALIVKLPALRVLCTRSVGFDHIDLDACKERGIVVCNVPDYGSHVIAEHVFALLLSTLRHVSEGEKRVEGGTFDYRGLRGVTLRNKTMGILGTGRIGRRVAQIAHGFGMKILAADQCRSLELVDLLGVQYVSFDELLAQSDVISLHMPATDETYHVIDDAAFAEMKQGAILVNTARGTLIDSKALLTAVKSGKLKYALLDVLEHEQNFEENKALIKQPNVITTPHVGFYADESMHNMYLDAFQSIEQWQRGESPGHLVHDWRIVCDLPKIKKS